MEKELYVLLDKIDDVLEESHADTQTVLLAGVQIIKSAFSQIVEDNPQADMESFADNLAQTLNKSLRHIVKHPNKELEA